MASEDFGNEQEMPVAEKVRPTLGPTEASQNVEERAVQVVGMPAHTDPNNPLAASGSVNLPLDKHPVTHSEDFGATVLENLEESIVDSTMSEGAKTLHELAADATAKAAKRQSTERPADRAEWAKKDWVSQAEEYGLAKSGNTETVQARVEEYEAMVDEAGAYSAEDWKTAIEDAKSAEDVAELKRLYDASGASYSTVEEAFAAKSSEGDAS